MNSSIRQSNCTGLKDVCEIGTVGCSTVFPDHLSAGSYWGAGNSEDDMCQIDDKDDLGIQASVKFSPALLSADLNKVLISIDSMHAVMIWSLG